MASRGEGGGGREGRLGKRSGGVPRAAARPLILVLGGELVHGACGGQHSGTMKRKVDPLLLLPLAAPSQRYPMLEGHVEVCGAKPHTSRVASQVERAQRHHATGLRHRAKGLAGEKAPGLGATPCSLSPMPWLSPWLSLSLLFSRFFSF